MPDLTNQAARAIFFSIEEGAARMASPQFTRQMTIPEWESLFPSDDACKAYLTARRWPCGTIVCQRCTNDKVYPVTGRPFHWQCTRCAAAGGYRFSVRVNTIFSRSGPPIIPLWREATIMRRRSLRWVLIRTRPTMPCISAVGSLTLRRAATPEPLIVVAQNVLFGPTTPTMNKHIDTSARMARRKFFHRTQK